MATQVVREFALSGRETMNEHDLAGPEHRRRSRSARRDRRERTGRIWRRWPELRLARPRARISMPGCRRGQAVTAPADSSSWYPEIRTAAFGSGSSHRAHVMAGPPVSMPEVVTMTPRRIARYCSRRVPGAISPEHRRRRSSVGCRCQRSAARRYARSPWRDRRRGRVPRRVLCAVSRRLSWTRPSANAGTRTRLLPLTVSRTVLTNRSTSRARGEPPFRQ